MALFSLTDGLSATTQPLQIRHESDFLTINVLPLVIEGPLFQIDYESKPKRKQKPVRLPKVKVQKRQNRR